MMRSLFSAVSGIQNHQTWMDIIGNNIANVNTIGFKGSRASFAEMLAQTLHPATGPSGNFGGSNPIQVGLGMKLMAVDTQFNQGTFESTGNYTDLAIQGDGFFVVSDGDQRFFTRAGAFSIDADGYLTAQGGTMRVQGYMANQLGVIANNLAPGDIQIPFGMKAPASATTEIELYCNLDAEATDSTATLVNPGTTGVTTVSGEAINGAGGTHTVTISGNNATQGYGSGTNAGGLVLDLATSLGDVALGITDFTNFEISVDGGSLVPITGLSATSNIGNLIDAINAQVSGVTASLVGGEIQINRDWYGAGSSISLSGDIFNQVFDNGAGGGAWSTNWTDGLASTLVASDSFVPSYGGAAIVTNLTLEADETTGLITNITDLGGGGVTVYASPNTTTPPGGLAAGNLVIDTDDTTHVTSIVTYDSLGGEHVLNINFTKTATTNLWNWEVEVEDPAQVISGNTGTVTFNDDGSLESFNYNGGVLSFSFNPNNGAAPVVNIELDAGMVGGVDGMTQFASATTTIVQNQDGYGMGDLINVSIDENGTILGSFTNDQILTLAQIVLADFHNPQGLLKGGDNFYRISGNSGDPIYGLPLSNLGSSVHSGYVEMSNVDISKQFADMIVAQRGFQASARVITTSDRMLDELLRIKRM
jgi:flagellar hook protein FlgE